MAEKIFLGDDGAADKYFNVAVVIGDYGELYCNGERYYVIVYSGVAAKHA